MSGKPYDAAVKTLIGTRPNDWLRFLKLPTDVPVTFLDTDLSVVSAATDALLRVEAEQPFGVHVEFETGHHGAKLPARLCAYNSQAAEQTGLTFLSVLVLLNPSADSPAITGIWERRLTSMGDRLVHRFEYEVLRVWKIAPEQFFQAGFGLLPFAPTGNIALIDVPSIIERMTETVDGAVANRELTDTEANDLWYATYIFMGPRFGKELSQQLIRKVKRMRESPTFQAILEEGREEGRQMGLQEGREKGLQEGLQEGRQEGRQEGLQEGREEGRAEGVRESLLRIGGKRFGIPSPDVVTAIKSIQGITWLTELEDRLLAVESWDELLADTQE